MNISPDNFYNVDGKQACSCCDNWLAHWENNTSAHPKPTTCVAVDLVALQLRPGEKKAVACTNPQDDGAHVSMTPGAKINSGTAQIYIVPFCDSHNGKNSKYKMELSIDCRVDPVKLLGCGKTSP